MFAAGCFVLICSGLTFAQDTVSPQKKALILEFIEVAGGKNAANEMVDIMLGAQEVETEENAYGHDRR